MADEEEGSKNLGTDSMPSGDDAIHMEKDKVLGDSTTEPTTEKALPEKNVIEDEPREGEDLAISNLSKEKINFAPGAPEIESTTDIKENTDIENIPADITNDNTIIDPSDIENIPKSADITNDNTIIDPSDIENILEPADIANDNTINDPAECLSEPQFLQESISEINLIDHQELSSDNLDVDTCTKSVPVDIPQPNRDISHDKLLELVQEERKSASKVSYDDIETELPTNNKKKASGDITLIGTRHDVSYIQDSEDQDSEDTTRDNLRPRATLTSSISECTFLETVPKEEDMTIIHLLPENREKKFSYEELIKDESFDENTEQRTSTEDILKEGSKEPEPSPSTIATVPDIALPPVKTSPRPAEKPSPELPNLKTTSKKSKWSRFTNFISLGLASKTLIPNKYRKKSAATPGGTSNSLPLYLPRTKTQSTGQPSRSLLRPPSAPQPSTTSNLKASGGRPLVAGSRFKLASKSKSNKQDEDGAKLHGNYQDPFYQLPSDAESDSADKDKTL